VTKNPDGSGWSAEGSYETSKGKSGSFSQQGSKNPDGGRERSTTFVDSDGKTYTSDKQFVWNPQTQTWTKTVTNTGPNGNTQTQDSSATVD
jgi:hypothetical protein